ncbi:MAG: hypothetical protein J2P27_00650 [Actinobacteria bacterium]|nr:hypothetical protein [Actinomycetota bacterium]
MESSPEISPVHDDPRVSLLRLTPILADTGRLVPGTVAASLVHAGRHRLVAIETDSGDWTLPDLAIAVFIEAEWEQLNKQLELVVELVDGQNRPAYFRSPPDSGGEVARIQTQVTVGPVPGAPPGMPAKLTRLWNFPAGSLWIPSPERRYVWQCSIGYDFGYFGFWVAAPS